MGLAKILLWTPVCHCRHYIHFSLYVYLLRQCTVLIKTALIVFLDFVNGFLTVIHPQDIALLIK
jgi:hypothetical protein